MLFPLAVELVEANSFLFPLLIGGGERVAVINTINKGRDKTLLEVMDKDSSVSFFVVTSLSDGGIETNEEIDPCRIVSRQCWAERHSLASRNDPSRRE